MSHVADQAGGTALGVPTVHSSWTWLAMWRRLVPLPFFKMEEGGWGFQRKNRKATVISSLFLSDFQCCATFINICQFPLKPQKNKRSKQIMPGKFSPSYPWEYFSLREDEWCHFSCPRWWLQPMHWQLCSKGLHWQKLSRWPWQDFVN